MRIKRLRAHTRIVSRAGVLLLCATLLSCSVLRYVRTETVAGGVLVNRLILDRHTFRLERDSDEGKVVYVGRFDVSGDLWTFQSISWSSCAGKSQQIDPPLLFVCRGRSFDNGVAFFVASSRPAGMDAFLELPSDFDREP